MLCPVCTTQTLQMAERHGIEIDYCPGCRGVWLDRGELDKIIERAGAAVPPPAPVQQQPASTPPPSLLSTSSLYAVASSVGNFCRKADMFHMNSSSMLPPQAGMPLALMPCLITQNASAGATGCLLRFGGAGYRPLLISVAAASGERWQVTHMAL